MSQTLVNTPQSKELFPFKCSTCASRSVCLHAKTCTRAAAAAAAYRPTEQRRATDTRSCNGAQLWKMRRRWSTDNKQTKQIPANKAAQRLVASFYQLPRGAGARTNAGTRGFLFIVAVAKKNDMTAGEGGKECWLAYLSQLKYLSVHPDHIVRGTGTFGTLSTM